MIECNDCGDEIEEGNENFCADCDTNNLCDDCIELHDYGGCTTDEDEEE